MATIFVQHRDDVRRRMYDYAPSEDLQEEFPEGVKLDHEAMMLLTEYLTQIQNQIGFEFEVYEDGVTITNLTEGGTWVGVCEHIESVIMQTVQDSVFRATGRVIEVA